MLKKCLLIPTFLFILPIIGWAYFDEMVQEKLLTDALLQLNDPDSKIRIEATHQLLEYPQWSLPIIRNTINNPFFEDIHWRLAYILGVHGTPSDIPNLLEYAPKEEDSFESKVWRGAAERIFWRHRQSQSQRYLIPRLSFKLIQCQGPEVEGILKFKIFNPDSEARLIHSHFNMWRAQLKSAVYQSYHWVESKKDIEVEVPISFIPRKGVKNVRFDLKVDEVGAPKKSKYILRTDLLKIKPAIKCPK